MTAKKKEYIREILTRAAVVLGLTTVVGMLSNILILVLGYLIALPHLFDYLTGYFMNLDNQKLWLLYAALSLLFCVILCGYLLTHVGASSAYYSVNRRTEPESRTLRLSDMFLCVGIGAGVHGILCWIVARMGLPYLFFAGPIQYIARLIGHGDRSLFADVSYYFPQWIVILSVAIYIACVFAGCCIGYTIGYRKKIIAIAAAEAEARRGTPPEKTWSAADAKQIPYAYKPEHTPKS